MLLADIPTVGLLVGLPVTIILLICCLIAYVVFRSSRSSYDKQNAWYALLAAAVVLLIAGIAFWPWKHDYHFYVDKQGRVEHIGSRFLTDSDGNRNQRYVLNINGQPYGVDDTRAASVNVGDEVLIRCRKDHQWFNPLESDGYVCRWGKTIRQG